jgi:hypothetical protein
MTGFDTLLFRCAICRNDVRDWPDRNGRDRHLEPICRMCEQMWTERTGKPKDGSMMDRRKAAHVLALSNAIGNTASIMEWEAAHARS